MAHVLARPEAVDPAGWRITAIFLATIAGLMLQPLPGAVIVIVGLAMFVLVGGLPMTEALTGFASPSVWLVLAAMLMARVLRESGLARRVALLFVRRFGHTSLGVSYALVMSDVTLAAGIPSITARSGGIILPITRTIAEIYESRPGPTAVLLGRFLMASLYQCSAVACAMFLTGQASNVLAAGLAAKFAGVTITWSSWFAAGIVPGIVSCLLVPLCVHRLLPPDITRTPAIADYARAELAALGRLGIGERRVLAIVSAVLLAWITSQWHGLDVTMVAFIGLGALLATGALSWDSALAERNAWDVFVWYGGLMTMGEVLNRTGSTTAFAQWIGGTFTGLAWLPAFAMTLVAYFYAHYAFASITTHILALFPPFIVMLVGFGTPPGLAVYSLACLANLTAGLTHYGTTTAPIVYAEGYVTRGEWWRIGFVASVVNLVVWTSIGFGWWKAIGLW